MTTYTGGCHCGKVRYEVDMELGDVISCNCSHCGVKALLLSFVPADSLRMLAGEEDMSEYRFNKHAIAHRFCSICGVEPFGLGSSPDGALTAAINVRTLDSIDTASLTIVPVDGKAL